MPSPKPTDDRRLVLATGNAGKLSELRAMLSDYAWTVESQRDLGVSSVPETGETFVENAIIKARHAADVTGLPAIADDSGLEVMALDGLPGVRSARYAGAEATDADNTNKLLSAMADVADRTAAFRCVMVFMRHASDPMPLIASGSWYGEIAVDQTGQGGFGYDPVFYVPALSCTAATLAPEQKNALSHRASALSELLAKLKTVGYV